MLVVQMVVIGVLHNICFFLANQLDYYIPAHQYKRQDIKTIEFW